MRSHGPLRQCHKRGRGIPRGAAVVDPSRGYLPDQSLGGRAV